MAELACWLHFSPSDIGRLRLSELVQWADQAQRVGERYLGAMQR